MPAGAQGGLEALQDTYPIAQIISFLKAENFVNSSHQLGPAS
jgi:hypothetical protein